MIPAQILNIQTCVAEYYGLPLKFMTSHHRARKVSRPRMLAMFLCKELTSYSYDFIGKAFGRDHSTVVHAVDTMRALFRQHPELEPARAEILAGIRNCPQSDVRNRDALFLPVLSQKHEVVNAETR